MSKAKHTPGPWEALSDETPWTEGDAEVAQEFGEPFGATEILFSIDAPNAGERIALCPWLPLASEDQQERLRANARLIAAAPDLLAALEECEYLMRRISEHTVGMTTLVSAPLTAARAALAKARGEA